MAHTQGHLNRMRPGIKRRHFIVATGSVLGALALRGHSATGAPAHFSHGVASGDPLADRVILWTRVVPGSGRGEFIEVHWEVAEDPQFRKTVVRGASATSQSWDYTLKVDATGLSPGRTYYYRFQCQGIYSPVGRTRTLPAENVERIRLGVVSCSNYPQGYFHVYRELARRPDINAVLHLGDYIYEYAQGQYANRHMLEQGRGVEPEHEIVTLEDYRSRYALYRSDPDLQLVHRAHPFICVWDDHEISNNTWRQGAPNHNEGEGPFEARRRAAIRAFYEWLPIREYGSIQDGKIYRSFDFGRLASLIMLDTRLVGRDRQLSGSMADDELKTALADPQRSMLGVEQEQWLAAELARSAAAERPWQIIGQQVIMGKLLPPMFKDEQFDERFREQVISGSYGRLRERARRGFTYNLDAWNGYPAARERVYKAFRQSANNVVVLTGDTHSSWALDLRDENGAAVAVEFATPSVSSPGFEFFLPVPVEQLEEVTLASNPDLRYCFSYGRGWIELDVTQDTAISQWMYVTTVHETDYQVVRGTTRQARAGRHIIDV
ncbi:alkaline phosphatase D family protein [Gilvimarinus sp. F26214L]